MCMLRALESTWETHLGLTAVLLRPIEATSPLGCLNARIQDLSRGTADMKASMQDLGTRERCVRRWFA